MPPSQSCRPICFIMYSDRFKKSRLVMNSHLLIPVYTCQIRTFLGIHTSLSLYICQMYYSSLIPRSWRQHLAPFHSPLTPHSLCFQHSMRYPVPVSYSILPSWVMTHHLLKSRGLGKRLKLRYILVVDYLRSLPG